ncbi:hypothetical protein GCM10010230_05310 [Streptomyces narbonensis]|uniref:hypothetical protein n=1 Tax=Streptomyces narbonensis TaxID=67333 RepID=UPI00167244BB|nr:hypothetical protein [Streptomyces narbonensis]GGV93748.1 hypothetical protein GCM10010230_05310 [Streptomyces narbonensis]
MFLLEFDHDSVREPSEKQAADLAATSEMNLRYGYFETRIFIAATGFEAERMKSPLLDFVHCALLAAQAVSHGQPGRISFTESSLLIEFLPSGEELTVLRSWDPVPGSCAAIDFLESVLRFSVDALKSIGERHPDFRRNAYHETLSRMIEEVEPAPGR